MKKPTKPKTYKPKKKTVKKPVKLAIVKKQGRPSKAATEKLKETAVKSIATADGKNERQELYIIYYRESMAQWNPDDAARQMAIPLQTFYTWMRDPVFNARVRDAQNKKADNIFHVLYNKSLHGDTKSASLFLQYISKRTGDSPDTPYVDAELARIVGYVKDDPTRLREGLYECTMKGYKIPEAMKLELTAQTAFAALGAMGGEGKKKPLTVEELEARADAAWEKVNRENYEWKPGRRLEIEGIRAEVDEQLKGRNSPDTFGEDDGDGE